MKIMAKSNLLFLGIILVMTVSVLAAGMVIIDDILYRFQERVLRLELAHASQAILQKLNRSGARAAAQTAAELQAQIEHEEGWHGARLYIIESPDQRVVFHPDLEAGERADFPFVADMFVRKEGVIEYDFKDIRRFAAFTTVDPLGWLVGLSIPRDQMLARKYEFLRAIGAITLIVLCLNALVINLYGRRLTRRLGSALDCVNRIERGELSARIADPGAADELGRLQAGINAMSERIEQRTRERQEAEAALREREARIRRLVESNIIGIIFWRFDGTITEANDAFLQMVGHDRADLAAGRVSWRTLTPPEYLEATLHALEEIREGGVSTPYEKEYLRPDGRRVPVLVGGARVEEGGEAGLSFVLDLTERKAAEERFRQVVEAAPNAMILTGRDGRMTLVNAQAERLFGYAREELLGQSVEMLVPQGRRQRHARHRADYFASPRITMTGVGKDFHGRRRDGSEFPMEVVLNPVETAAGPVVLASVVDISEHRQAEADRQARLAAEAANRAKSAFLATMSHELRTPLNAILGYAQLLQNDAGLSERQATGLATIRDSGQQLLTLINDLLDLAKIEAGKLELHPAPLDLAACLAVVARIMRVRVQEKRLAFVHEAPADLPPLVLADERCLRQVLLNLLANAVNFTDHGQVALRVRVLARDWQAVRLHFEVADSGVGMSPEQMAGLFQPFEQVGDVRRRAGGTGLGLAISRQLVRLMAGEIEVDSRPGGGSRFWFDISLPLAAGLAGPPAAAAPIAGYVGERRRILVADDVAANRAFLADLLDSLGFEVSAASDGGEAVRLARTAAPALVLMDLVMPGMDGLEAIRAIRASPGLERLPIVAVSASANQADQDEALAAGADAFLAKPIDQERLLQAVGECLGLQWIPAGAPAVPEREASAALVLPPAAEMAVLHRLALTGNMRAIRERAAQLATQGEAYRPFADTLLRLARGYQSKAILQLIEDHSHREPTP